MSSWILEATSTSQTSSGESSYSGIPARISHRQQPTSHLAQELFWLLIKSLNISICHVSPCIAFIVSAMCHSHFPRLNVAKRERGDVHGAGVRNARAEANMFFGRCLHWQSNSF